MGWKNFQNLVAVIIFRVISRTGISGSEQSRQVETGRAFRKARFLPGLPAARDELLRFRRPAIAQQAHSQAIPMIGFPNLLYRL